MKRRICACPLAAFIGVLALASFVHAQAASATVGGTARLICSWARPRWGGRSSGFRHARDSESRRTPLSWYWSQVFPALHMWRWARGLAFLIIVSIASSVRAQSPNASLAGRVTDPTGAAIGDARIAAISADTNVRHEATTGVSGSYSVANIPPGTYRVEVEKPGFKKLIRPDVIVHVQDALELDFEMTRGAVSEAVTVEGGAPLVNTTSGEVSTVIDRAFIENLPMNGRSFQTLIMLAPGVVVTPTSFSDQGQFSVNGQRADANYFTVDGVSANFGVTGYFPMMQTASGALPALSAAGGTNSLASVDALQEFRVQTSSFAPEFGRTPGGQISIVTRSGTNTFHGSLFEYFRHDALDAKDWFVNANGLDKPEQRQSDFGGVIGGPLRADRTFFFFSYEGLRLRQPASLQTAVPDAASRQQAPATMRPYLDAYPMPNGAALGGGLAQFNASYFNPSTLDATSIRVDHVVSPKLNVFARYNYSPSDFDQRGGTFSTRVLSATSSLSSSVQTFTAGVTHLIKPGLNNEVRANYSDHRMSIRYTMDDFGGAVPLPDSLLFPSGYSSADSGFLFLINGAGQYAQGKIGTDEQHQVNLVDTISAVKGGHQMKFGVDYRRLAPSSSPFAYRQFVQFTGVTSAPGGAVSGTAAFVQPAAFQENALRSQNLSLYGQDTWNITPRLTATYGLRWDVNPPLKGKDTGNDPFTVQGLDIPATMTLAPRGTPLYETTYGNVAPRLGLTYQLGGRPNWEATLRGGVGVFYDLGQGSLGGVTSYFPYGASKVIQPSPTPFPLNALDAAPPAFTVDPPVNTILVADPHLKLPRTYQWNVALEQSVGRSQSLSATYLGAMGRDLLRMTTLLNVNPNFLSVSLTDNSATSDYHALQLKFHRRLSRGFQGIASYTLAHSADSASTDAGTYRSTPGPSGADADHANSDFDIRHSFTAGVTYVLPAAGSHQAARAILDGWSLDAFVFARSAAPVDILGNILFGGGTVLASRPNVIDGVPLELYGPQYPGGKIFNRAAFTPAPAGQQGNFGRNVLRGFAAAQADVAVQRKFEVSGKVKLHFRVEFFNIFNEPNFGPPTNVLTSPLFGYSTQTLANSLGSGGANGGFNPLYQIGGPRSIQLALRLEF
jgi:Carboxypeptidase regulatory-like domain/TonB dependent receptor-like, beta-barrel